MSNSFLSQKKELFQFLMRNTIFGSKKYGNCVNLFLKNHSRIIGNTIYFLFGYINEPKATSIITFAVHFLFLYFILLLQKGFIIMEKKLSSAQSAIKVLKRVPFKWHKRY